MDRFMGRKQDANCLYVPICAYLQCCKYFVSLLQVGLFGDLGIYLFLCIDKTSINTQKTFDL